MSEMKKTSSKKQKLNDRKIYHEIFNECVAYNTDVFWIQKLRNAAKGKFPPKFYYQNNILSYGKTKKSKRILLSDDPQQRCEEFITFIRNNGCKFSPTDIYNSKAIELKNSDLNYEVKWTSTSMKMKDCMIYNFVNTVSEKYSFDNKTKFSLLRTLRYDISNKKIDDSCIFVKRNKIEQISSLILDKNSFRMIPSQKKTVKKICKLQEFHFSIEKSGTKGVILSKWKKILGYTKENQGTNEDEVTGKTEELTINEDEDLDVDVIEEKEEDEKEEDEKEEDEKEDEKEEDDE